MTREHLASSRALATIDEHFAAGVAEELGEINSRLRESLEQITELAADIAKAVAENAEFAAGRLEAKARDAEALARD